MEKDKKILELVSKIHKQQTSNGITNPQRTIDELYQQVSNLTPKDQAKLLEIFNNRPLGK